MKDKDFPGFSFHFKSISRNLPALVGFLFHSFWVTFQQKHSTKALIWKQKQTATETSSWGCFQKPVSWGTADHRFHISCDLPHLVLSQVQQWVHTRKQQCFVNGYLFSYLNSSRHYQFKINPLILLKTKKYLQLQTGNTYCKRNTPSVVLKGWVFIYSYL